MKRYRINYVTDKGKEDFTVQDEDQFISTVIWLTNLNCKVIGIEER
jgi:hypothetical protein